MAQEGLRLGHYMGVLGAGGPMVLSQPNFPIVS